MNTELSIYATTTIVAKTIINGLGITIAENVRNDSHSIAAALADHYERTGQGYIVLHKRALRGKLVTVVIPTEED